MDKQNFNYDCDRLYERFKHLCGDPKFKPHYVNKFYQLGSLRVCLLAEVAQEFKLPLGKVIKSVESV